MPNAVACPTCGNKVIWSPGSPWRPFCSERCKLIDLGDWLDENHRITESAQGAYGEADAENWPNTDNEEELQRH
jgi:endogenous inhibitor of DNA gyrase (YacG/DUF329 family)